MNKKLALKISKHPLIKKLMEDRATPKSDIARLIVEDLMEAQSKLLVSALATLRRDFNSNKEGRYINSETKQPVYPYARLGELEEQEQEKYKDAVNKKVQAFLAQQNLDTQAKGEELEKKVDNAIDREIATSQTNPQELVDVIISTIVDMNKEQEFVSTYEQNAPAALDFVVNRLPEEQVDVLKKAPEETQQKVVKAVADELEPETTEPSEPQTEPEAKEEPTIEPKADEDPEKFDVASEDLQSLISVSEEFIEEFYEKALLRDQGKLVRNVLDQLVKITEKEELEKAAQRKPQPKPEPVQEQQQNPSALRNIQVDLKSFIKLAKRSKEVLQRFDEASDKGKVIGSSLKKKFMEMLAQLQENIRDLVQDISKLNLVQEAKDTSEIEKKWDAIEKGYNDASRALTGIIGFGSDKKEAFDMENSVKDAYNALMSISHFFPSVNPFGKKTSQDMKKYSEQYGAAIKDVKSVLRDVLELSQGQGGRSTASNAIKALKEFSGQIQSIFDVKSKFDDVVVQPNEPAAEGEPQPQKEKSYAYALKDKALSFLASLISKGKNKRDVQSDIEKQEALDKKQKQILSSIVKRFGLTDLQEKAKMTPGEMKLYIQLLIALEEKGIVKLNEAVPAGKEIYSKIKDVIGNKFQQDEETLLNILKKEGVISHLQTILKGVEYDENIPSEVETEQEEESDFSFFSHKGSWERETEKEEPYPEDTRYLSREEEKLAEKDYAQEAKTKFFEQLHEATRKYYEKNDLNHLFSPNTGMRFSEVLAALKMANQKQKTATEQENIEAVKHMESAKNVTPENVDDYLSNFKQFLGNSSEYQDYEGSKKILVGYLGIMLMRYSPIIPFIDNETLKSIKEYINEEPKKKKETAEDFYAGRFVPDSVKEQIIATKLKPLIREMLNKGK
jgi:hypothetical protein